MYSEPKARTWEYLPHLNECTSDRVHPDPKTLAPPPPLSGQVDVWSLGISAIEMGELHPPRWAVHPMRVIFMISRDPPPHLSDKDKWSLPMHDFIAQCLQKDARVGGRCDSAKGSSVCWHASC